MIKKVTETFFLPDELSRNQTRIPADIYNLTHHLISRSELSCVFVPIRSLQILAVITDHEIVFVDSMAYTHHNDEGGRVIIIAWKPVHTHDRQSLEEPVDMEVVFYRDESENVQARLIVEFRNALQLMDKYYREESLPAEGAKIVKLK